jgi:hypothetical protein
MQVNRRFIIPSPSCFFFSAGSSDLLSRLVRGQGFPELLYEQLLPVRGQSLLFVMIFLLAWRLFPKHL